jgi:molecular chaperone IbpA
MMHDIPNTIKDFDDVFNKAMKYTTTNMDELLKNIGKNNLLYPPFNAIKVTDNSYVLEIAVAGFTRSELEVTLDENNGVQFLRVSGKKREGGPGHPEVYLWQGIANRSFTKEFVLGTYVEIGDVRLESGMLVIELKTKLPLTSGSKKIAIK